MTLTTQWPTQPAAILNKIFEYADPLSAVALSSVDKRTNTLFSSPSLQARLIQLHHYSSLSPTLSPNDQYLALTTAQSTKTRSILPHKFTPLKGAWTDNFIVHPDLRRGLSSQGEIFYLWNLPGGQRVQTFVGHTSPIQWIGFHGDETCVTKSATEIKIWDLEQKKCIKTITKPEIIAAKNIDVRPRHGQIVCMSDTQLQLWDIETEKNLLTIEKEDVEFVSDLFLLSCDGKTALLCLKNETLKLYCLASGKCLLTIDSQEPFIDSLAMNDQSTKAYTTWNQRIKVWDLTTGNLLQTIGSDSNLQISCLKITPDGNRIISNNMDGTFKIWHHATGQFLEAIDAPDDSLRCEQISSDGTRALIMYEQFDKCEYVNLSPLPHELVNEAAMSRLKRSGGDGDAQRIHRFIWENMSSKSKSPYRNNSAYQDFCDYSSEVFLPGIKKYLTLYENARSEKDKQCYWTTAYTRFNQLPSLVQMAIYNRMRLLQKAMAPAAAQTCNHEKDYGKEAFHSKDVALVTKIMALEGKFTTVAQAKLFIHQQSLANELRSHLPDPITRSQKRQRTH